LILTYFDVILTFCSSYRCRDTVLAAVGLPLWASFGARRSTYQLKLFKAVARPDKTGYSTGDGQIAHRLFDRLPVKYFAQVKLRCMTPIFCPNF